MTELWKEIPSCPGYEASSIGRVRSRNRVVHYRDGRKREYPSVVLQPGDNGKGYLQVNLNGRTVRVHTAVLEAFIGPRPAGTEACHNDGNRANNALTNLRWDTPSNNQQDSIKHGTHAEARRTHCLRGHPLLAPNLSVAARGRRQRECLACKRAASVYTVDSAAFSELADLKYQEILKYGAGIAPREQCPRGHDLFEFNLKVGDLRRGIRNCLACRRASNRASDLRSKGRDVSIDDLADAYYAEIVRKAGAA